jgi:Spy/CpxP family protein refolding chaperone
VVNIERSKAIFLALLVAVAAILVGVGAVLTVTATGNGEEGSHCSGVGCARGGHGFWGNLTDEQRDAIITKVKEMRDAGATWEEIKAEITAMLQGWGIDVSAWEGLHNGAHSGQGCLGHNETATTPTTGS